MSYFFSLSRQLQFVLLKLVTLAIPFYPPLGPKEEEEEEEEQKEEGKEGEEEGVEQEGKGSREGEEGKKRGRGKGIQPLQIEGYLLSRQNLGKLADTPFI